MKPIGVGILVVVGFFILTVAMSANMGRQDTFVVVMPHAINILSQLLGLIIITTAALSLLFRTGSSQAAGVFPIALGLLGGVLLVERHWSVLIAFLGVATLLWVNERFRPV